MGHNQRVKVTAMVCANTKVHQSIWLTECSYPSCPCMTPLGQRLPGIPHQSSEQAFQQGHPGVKLKRAHYIFLSNTNYWPYPPGPLSEDLGLSTQYMT